jgi:CopA family copper-resistance protein
MNPEQPNTVSSGRRRLLKSALGAGGIALLDAFVPAWARSMNVLNQQAVPLDQPLEFDLSIGEERMAIAGGTGQVQAINNTIPGPLLEWYEGQDVVLNVANTLKADTSIHWHGILLPFEMDGVPGVTFQGIKPGTTFQYRFPVKQSGTYWYHSHSGLQEQLGVYGPLVVHPRDGYPQSFDRDYVVMLSDWTFEDPHHLMAKLKKQADYYNYQQRTLADILNPPDGVTRRAALRDKLAWDRMRMMQSDIADVGGTTYAFLMNGLHPAGNWTGLFRPGERVRLRFINGSAMSIFNVRIPGLEMQVVAADGQDVQPVATDEFQISTAETYDVIVEPREDKAYTVMAESIDRSGYAAGTLAPRPGMQAPVPPLRKPPMLSMTDMGMDHGDMPGMDHSSMNHGEAGTPAMDHSSMNHGRADKPAMDHASMNHGERGMKSMDHSAMNHGDADQPEMDHGSMNHGDDGMQGMDHGSMNHGNADKPTMDHGSMNHGPASMPGMDHSGHDMAAGAGPVVARHGPDEHGAGNAGVAAVQRNRLGERGTGLADEPHRVLVYTDLKRLARDFDPRPPGRELELHLTGHMERYMWSFDGVQFHHVDGPIEFEYGERLRLTLVNDTMMNHPIHLHGMWLEIENGHGSEIPRKHTINVMPASRVSMLINADAPGRWAFHCHLLYHMEMGMFRVVRVS